MGKNPILELIINFLNGVKNKDIFEYKDNNKIYRIKNCKYLLGQILRQYEIPQDHYFVSEKAFELWKQITNENILNFTYRDYVRNILSDEIKIKKYKSGENSFNEDILKLNKNFVYRDVFHDEHIIPVSVVMEKLLKLENPTYEQVGDILNHIYVCKILKEEDRNIKEKYKRPFDLETVLNSVYLNAGINVIESEKINEFYKNIKSNPTNINTKTQIKPKSNNQVYDTKRLDNIGYEKFWNLYQKILNEQDSPFYISHRTGFNCSLLTGKYGIIDLSFPQDKINFRIDFYISKENTKLKNIFEKNKDDIIKMIPYKFIWEYGSKNSEVMRPSVYVPIDFYNYDDYERVIKESIEVVKSFMKVCDKYIH